MIKSTLFVGMICLAGLVCIAFSMWAIYCYSETYRCRLKILECVRAGNRARFASGEISGMLYEAFLSVPHEAHLWSLLTFRDPIRLYPAEIRELVARCRAKQVAGDRTK